MTIYSDTLSWLDIAPIFDPIIDLDLITEFDFYLIARGFNRIFATGAACQQRTLTPPDTTLGQDPRWFVLFLQVFYCWDQSLLNLSCFRTLSFEHTLGTSVLLLYARRGTMVTGIVQNLIDHWYHIILPYMFCNGNVERFIIASIYVISYSILVQMI